MDENLAKIKAHELQIVGWMLIKDQQLMKFNLGTYVKPHMMKINAQLETCKVSKVEHLLKEFRDIFAWTYEDLKRIPPQLTQHKVDLDTIIPSTHRPKQRLNPNYVIAIKQNIDKLLTDGFNQFVMEATWLSPIIIILKKNDKLKNYIDFRKLNATTKKDPY